MISFKVLNFHILNTYLYWPQLFQSVPAFTQQRRLKEMKSFQCQTAPLVRKFYRLLLKRDVRPGEKVMNHYIQKFLKLLCNFILKARALVYEDERIVMFFDAVKPI